MNQKVEHTHTHTVRERENKGEYARALFEKKVGGAKSFREKRDLVYPYGIRITEEKKKGEKRKEKQKFIRSARSLSTSLFSLPHPSPFAPAPSNLSGCF